MNSVLLAILLSTQVLFNNNWSFHLGDAASKEADFTHGSEYFTHFAKIRSNGTEGPAGLNFVEDSTWKKVSLPHDWVVDLPFSADASHSHGYKCVGYKYPQNSVGWYRKEFFVSEEERGQQIFVEFEGIFRDSEVFVNGVYLGHERSGYASRTYDLTDHILFGQNNLIVVRCDASIEEGWYYEGAGIYRNVYLRKTGPVALEPYSLKIEGTIVDCEYHLADPDIDPSLISREVRFFDAEGKEVNELSHLWSVDDPYLYTAQIDILYKGELSERITRRVGNRSAEFSAEQGFLLNGQKLFLRGANVHLDAAGVGVGVPDELWRYRIAKLKEYGFNAIRCSHNPASPAMLDLCDEMGMLVIDEARQLGSHPEALELLENMVCRDRNHPCVILWSIGNEEWQARADGTAVGRKMVAHVHKFDSRQTTYGNSGGEYAIDDVVDVPGYNYIRQNHIDLDHEKMPWRSAVGTEETTNGWIRGEDSADETSAIVVGWDFYTSRPWTAGLFYWTGFDYRGEPNPSVWPNTGSLFGILDYCGFPKAPASVLWKSAEQVRKDAKKASVRTRSRRNVQKITLTPHKTDIKRDGQDIVVIDISSICEELDVKVEGPAELLGWGNGDPAFKYVERPADGRSLTIYPFHGNAQIIIRSIAIENLDEITVKVGGKVLKF